MVSVVQIFLPLTVIAMAVCESPFAPYISCRLLLNDHPSAMPIKLLFWMSWEYSCRSAFLLQWHVSGAALLQPV